MKRIAIILSLTTLLAASCVESLPQAAEDDARPRVAVTFGVPDDPVTKGAAGEQPSISEVWVAEFSSSGWFRSWTKAEPVSGHITQTGSAGAKTYTVNLPVSDADQRFHIVADPPQTPSMTNMAEEEALSSLWTASGNECFWQRIVVSGGVRGRMEGGNFVATPETQAAFSSLALVRNTALVRVISSTGSPSITQYALVNAPVKGYVAPLDMGTMAFSSQYQNPATLSFADVRAGYTPRYVDIAKTTTASSLQYRSSGPLPCYERPVPTADPTAVLVQTSRGWYKVEILHGVQYVPLLRGFTYTVDLGGIDFDGEPTAQEALDGPSIGDVSASLETASLKTVSAGGHSLTVGFTDYTATASGDVAHLSYQFIPATGTVTAELIDAGSGAVAAGTTFTVSGSSGTLNIPLTAPAGSMKKSVVRISGQANATSLVLYRNVTLRVMGQLSLSGDVTAAGTAKGSAVDLTVTLPPDLGSSLFPMTICVEASDNSLTSDDASLSTESGPSLFGGTARSFHFVKMILYTDYYDAMTKQYTQDFSIGMKRNIASQGTMTIRLADQLGQLGSCDLTL